MVPPVGLGRLPGHDPAAALYLCRLDAEPIRSLRSVEGPGGDSGVVVKDQKGVGFDGPASQVAFRLDAHQWFDIIGRHPGQPFDVDGPGGDVARSATVRAQPRALTGHALLGKVEDKNFTKSQLDADKTEGYKSLSCGQFRFQVDSPCTATMLLAWLSCPPPWRC